MDELALNLFNPERWQTIGSICLSFSVTVFLLDLLISIIKVKNFTHNSSGKVDITALWNSIFTNPLPGVFLIAVVLFGITSAQGFSEYYRIVADTWHDSELWALEEPIFVFLKSSIIDVPIFWDNVYTLLWQYILLGFSVLYRQKYYNILAIFSISFVLSFFLTRWIAIYYPTAGPFFHKPNFFDLTGTVSATIKESLLLYMKGEIQQNGWIPGTMGMPSLHVGLTFLTAWFLALNLKWTLWFSIPWLVLTWLSTVMLGWHYILDGVGGILVSILAVIISRYILSVLRFSQQPITTVS